MISSPVQLTRSTLINGVELRWDVWGPDGGAPLLLCHGFSGSVCDFALHIDRFVERGYKVMALEHRGHGRSAHGAPADYQLAQLTDDLIQLIPVISPEPVTLLGHSMGGHLAMRVAIQAPQLLRSLIVMDSSGWAFREEGSADFAMLQLFLEHYDPAEGLPSLPAGPEQALVESSVDAEELMARSAVQALMDPYVIKILGRELFTSSESLRELLPQVSMPVTVVCGSLDEPLATQAPALAELLSADLVMIEGAYHSPQLTHQDEWFAAITDHVDALG